MSFRMISWALQLIASVVVIQMPIQLEAEPLEINGFAEMVYTVDLDMTSEYIELDQGFSFDMFYGFETTSEISKRHEADIAINGLFYNSYGMPYGIIVDDSKVIGINSTKGPTVIVSEDNQVLMSDLTIEGYVEGNDYKVQLWGVNISAPEHSFVLYDAVYGKTTRIYRNSITYVLENNMVIDVIRGDTPVSTDLGESLLVHITPTKEALYAIGEQLTISYEYIGYEGTIKEAFQTGGWLVKEGINVAKAYEAYVGYTTSLQPRTLVGVTSENHLIFMVIDGRNPGVSEGVTGSWAAELLIRAGCTSGGYLDGGASSTLVIGDLVKNKPSDGTERAIAHALLIHITK